MAVKSDDIRATLKAIFPKLKHIWLTDREYLTPAFAEMEERLNYSWPKVAHEPTVTECEEFALFLHSDIKYQDSGQTHNWAFGEAFAEQLNGQRYFHVVNICVCDDGVYLIDAQAQEIRPAVKDKDRIFFLRM